MPLEDKKRQPSCQSQRALDGPLTKDGNREPLLRQALGTQQLPPSQVITSLALFMTLLIIRDAFLGIRRFDDFQRSLGIARNVLNTRLQRLCDSGLLERRLYQE